MIAIYIAAYFAGSYMVFQIFTVILAAKFQRRRNDEVAGPQNLAPEAISVLVPVKGPAPHLSESVGSLLTQDFAGPLEIIFAFESPDDPAIPELRALTAATRPGVTIKILDRCDRAGLNPKNSNLYYAFKQAQHAWIYCSDADTRLRPEHLRRALALTGGNPKVFVSALTMHFGARNLWARLETVGSNLEMTVYFMMLSQKKGEGLVNGGGYLAHRSLLEVSGGFASSLDFLTDDLFFERKFIANGATGRLHPNVISVRQEHESFAGYFRRQVRWVMIVRSFKSSLFWIAPLYWTWLWLAVLALCAKAPVILALSGAVFLSRVAQSAVIERLFLGRAHLSSFALILYDLLTPFVWLRALLSRRIRWAGNDLRATRTGRLVKVEA